MKLTVKQKAFADYYLQLGNATQAAIKAGYSKRTAAVIGNENLIKPYIKTYIDERLQLADSKRIADADEVLQYLSKVMRGEETEEVVIVENIGDYMSKAKKVEKDIGAKDRIKAAELLGKRYSIFTDRVDVSGTLPVQIIDDIPKDDEDEI